MKMRIPYRISLGDIKDKISELSKIDKTFDQQLSDCESALSLLNEIASFVRSYKDKVDVDPNRLEEIRDRLGAINLLKKKYGGSVNSVIEHRKKIGFEFELSENFSKTISALTNQITLMRKESGLCAKKLSQERKSAAKKVKKEIEDNLKYLGIS